MTARRIEVDILSIRSLENLKKELKAYKDSLPERTAAFVAALAEVGYKVANDALDNSSHQMGDRVNIVKTDVSFDETGCYAIIKSVPKEILATSWYRRDKDGKGVEVTGSLNPALAVEFGTASKALPPQERFGGYGGQGTNSKGGNAGRSEWWFARGLDENGKPTDWKRGTAIKPTRPLHNALLAMESEIDTIARRYF